MAAKDHDITDRTGGARSLASLVPRLTRAALGKRGFAEAGLLADWAAIVGEEIASRCLPERLDFAHGERREGTLHLRVEGAWALALQHLEPQLVERINGAMGYAAVARLKLHQGPLPTRVATGRPARAAPSDPALEAQAATEVAAQVATIADPALRAAVGRLGIALLLKAGSAKEKA